MGALQLKDLNKSYGAVKVLHDIDLTIEDGEFVVFVSRRAAENPPCCGSSPDWRM